MATFLGVDLAALAGPPQTSLLSITSAPLRNTQTTTRASLQSIGRMGPRSYSTNIRLISRGQATCAVIYPGQLPDGKQWAQRIAEAIQSLGTSKINLVPDSAAFNRQTGKIAEEYADKSLILIGDLNTNRAIFHLYANYYTCCDASYPGGAGYILQTVVHPFGQKTNYLIAGGSMEEGIATAVERLLARLKALKAGGDVELPYCCEVQPGSDIATLVDPVAREALGKTPASSTDQVDFGLGRDRFTQNAHLYFLTGNETFAEQARDWALYLADYDKDVAGIRIDDYQMQNLAAAWRRVSVSPAFTPEQCMIIDNKMLGTVTEQERSWWRQKSAARGIGMRHHTTGMLAWWTLIRVLSELGQPDVGTTRQLVLWRGEAEDYLNGLLRHYWDDADDYQSADSIQNTASFALQTGQLWWYDQGLARRAGHRLLAITDNLGWYAGIQGYGEALPGWERFTLDGGLLLSSCAFIYRDGGFQWVLDHFPALQRSWGSLQPWGLHQYATGGRIKPEQPDWLQGQQVTRFTPYRLNLINTGDFLKTDIMDGYKLTGLAARPVSEENSFDKLVIRDHPDPQSAYMLLQGMSGITLSTIDMNSIIRYTDQGHLWLVHNTGSRSLYFKNGIYISRGTNEQAVPAACELIAHADFGQATLATSRLPDYRGTTWTRHLATVQDMFAVVIDQVQANEPAHYVICRTWRTPGFATLNGRHWQSQQDETTFHLIAGHEEIMTSERAPQRDGATRPTVLREKFAGLLDKGQDLFLEGLLYTSGPVRRQEYEIRHVGAGVILIRPISTHSQTPFYLVMAGANGLSNKGLHTDATALLLGPGMVCLTGGSSLRIGTLDLKCTEGRIAIQAETDRILQVFLDTLWNQTTPKVEHPVQSVKSASPNAPAPAWTHPGPNRRGALMDGVRLVGGKNVIGPTSLSTDWVMPVLIAEPRLAPLKSQGLKLPLPKETPRKNPDLPVDNPQELTETVLSPLANAEFTVILPTAATVQELILYGNSYAETSIPPEPGELIVELTFSRDDFQRDKRTRQAGTKRNPSFHALYKGHSYMFESFTFNNLNEEALAIRVHVESGPSNQMMLSDVQVRVADTNGSTPIEVRPMDLDGDRKDEILAWTPTGHLSVIRADGTTLWEKDWPAGIIAIDAWDIEEDGTREVFVSLADRTVTVLNSDGSPRWDKDLSDMARQTDGKYFTDGSVVYGMVAWRPEGAIVKNVLLSGYFFASLCDAQGKTIECYRRDGHFTQSRQIPRGLKNGGDLVMRSDIPWVGPVPLTWLHANIKEPYSKCSVPNGPAVFMEVFDAEGNGRAEALVATDQGIGLYSPDEPKTRWEQMTDAPVAGVGIVQEGVGRQVTIVYGRQDGYIFIVDPQGRTLRSTLLDEPIRCLTVMPSASPDGQPMILAGTETALHGLKWDDLSIQWHKPGNYQRLEPYKTDGMCHILAVKRNGGLETFECK